MMECKSLTDIISYLNKRSYQSANNGNDVKISIYLEHAGEKELVVDRKGRENISNIRSLVKFNSPDKIHVELHENDKTHCFPFDLRKASEGEIMPFKLKKPSSNKSENVHEGELLPFNGFGQASLDEIINKRLSEERTQDELVELREKLIQRDNKIEKLKQQLGKLESDLNEADDEQERLEGIIKAKESIRYWAGFTGDVLEGLGFDKKKLRKPLAGFIEEEDAPKQIESPKQDESGIIEDVAEGKNDHVVSIISEFLKGLDNEILATIYEILVFIEKDPKTADYIYTHLKEREKTG